MKRQMHIRPGYDCGVDGATCQHEKKGKHGLCDDVWVYVVSEHTRAVSFEVFSGKYPPSVRPQLSEQLEKPRSGALRFHVASNTGQPCELVAGGLCDSDVTYLGGKEFWEQHGDPKQPEQGEAFWLALEARLPE